MLNIPDVVKALYLTEGRTDIRKNFRVTFPNGEYPDVNGDQIVSESVKFTESIMSQSSFRFGLAESPQIQFETVGVGNMLGMTISCWHEIETTSLSSADLAEIQAGTWDGELVLEADSDLGFGFFRIPLGTFVVDKCPRNHGALTHRRVVAYGPDLGKETALSPFYDFVAKQLYEPQNWRLYPYFFYANLYSTDRNVLNKFAHTSRAISESGQTSGVRILTLASGQPYSTIYFKPSHSAYGSEINYRLPAANSGMRLVRITGLKTAQAAVRSAIKAFLADKGITLAGSSYDGTTYATQDDAIEAVLRVGFGYAFVGFHQGISDTGSGVAYQARYVIKPTSDFIQLLIADTPMRGGMLDVNNGLLIPSKGSLKASLDNGADETILAADTPLVGGVETYDLTTPTGASTIPDFGISTAGVEVSGLYQYSQILDYMSVVTGLVEMSAQFGAIGRDGAFKLTALDPDNPYAITPDEYSECWYDEYEVSPIGEVNYTLVTGEEMTAEIGSGLSVYDMSGNAIIGMLASSDEVETLLKDDFAPGATALGFVPIELDARGMPWVEAGDAIQITTEDGETVESYVLERTISGIQSLTDDIRATGGDLIATEVIEY